MTINIRNGPVTFSNIDMKLYYCHIKERDINDLKTINNQMETSANKPINQEISILFDYIEL